MSTNVNRSDSIDVPRIIFGPSPPGTSVRPRCLQAGNAHWLQKLVALTNSKKMAVCFIITTVCSLAAATATAAQ